MGKIFLKTPAEIDRLRASGRLVAQTLALLKEAVTPGITTLELDKLAEQFIRKHRAVPSFKGYQGFPASVCCSINEQVVHGIPNTRKLKEGDIITLDVGAYQNGFHGDSAITVAVGKISAAAQELMNVTVEALHRGIQSAQVGARLGDIGYAIESLAQQHGYGVVREYTGHGIGRELHEAPHVLHYGKANTGLRLKEGMVFTIEPMLTAGSPEIQVKKDGWTAVTKDNSLCVQFEHML